MTGPNQRQDIPSDIINLLVVVLSRPNLNSLVLKNTFDYNRYVKGCDCSRVRIPGGYPRVKHNEGAQHSSWAQGNPSRIANSRGKTRCHPINPFKLSNQSVHRRCESLI